MPEIPPLVHIAADMRSHTPQTVTNPDPAGKSHPLAGQWHDLKAFQEATFGVLKDALKVRWGISIAEVGERG